MKYIVSVFLILFLLLELVGCVDQNSTDDYVTSQNHIENGTGEEKMTNESKHEEGDSNTIEEQQSETVASEAVTAANLSIKLLADDLCISREAGSFPKLPYYGWPSVAIDENDITYAVVSKRLNHIDPYGRVMLYKSFDRGLSWDEGVCIMDTILDDRDSGIVYMGNGRMLVTSFSHNSSLYVTNSSSSWTSWQKTVGSVEVNRVFEMWNAATSAERTGCSSYIISDDYGKTWSERKLMPITAPHGPSIMNDGTLMYIGVPKAPKFATGKDLASAVYCFVSTDNGETFTQRSAISVPSSYSPSEAYGIQLADGSIVGTVRTGSFTTLCYKSYDNGFTWTDAKEVTYGAPAHLIQADNGIVIMSYSKRKASTGQYIRLSDDNGETWDSERSLSRPRSASDTDLGYPATAKYSDGTFITVYYQKWKTDSKPSLMRTLWQLQLKD